jgi:hypothetical protein
VLDAVLTPNLMGAEDEFDIGSAGKIFVAVSLKLGNEVMPAVYSGIGNNRGTRIQTEGLMFVLGFAGGFQQRVPEADVAAEPYLFRVGPAKRQEIRQLLQQARFNGCAINVQDAYNAAHSVFAWPGLSDDRISISLFS